ncbi:uncharacterized protein LOC18434688 isoform X3 [Amborella trichopoda]|uniref:uncharacterized protein LOC18434688 isoform X3 n=1 Tax=Amborella trichopoda TaxID=13333 RepID=UPI0009C02065|nr:uncharacterized protein LOC18434688 isoform X3 [Amborella trichopoda]|eukprot:XP_020523258.1 uncharacterized protein LOC18434688 isoform X3 [Amborella trichopoda]
MPKRRAKRTTKEPPASLESKHEPLVEKQLYSTFSEQEVERREAAIRAIGNGEIEYMLSHLRNLHSFFTKEQLETPFLQFIEEKCPNIMVVKHDEYGECLLQWKALDCSPSLSFPEDKTMLPLLGPCGSVGQQGYLAYPHNCDTLPAFGWLPIFSGREQNEDFRIRKRKFEESKILFKLLGFVYFTLFLIHHFLFSIGYLSCDWGTTTSPMGLI